MNQLDCVISYFLTAFTKRLVWTEQHGHGGRGFFPSGGNSLRNRTYKVSLSRAFFNLIFFNFSFCKNIFLFLKFTRIYLGRPAAGRQELTYKKKTKKFADRSLGTGRPAAGRPAPQAARLRGGRHPHPI